MRIGSIARGIGGLSIVALLWIAFVRTERPRDAVPPVAVAADAALRAVDRRAAVDAASSTEQSDPRKNAVGRSATGVVIPSFPAAPAPAAWPATVERDAATGVPRLRGRTADTDTTQPTFLPPGGSANGVVTDPATGVTRVGVADTSR